MQETNGPYSRTPLAVHKVTTPVGLLGGLATVEYEFLPVPSDDMLAVVLRRSDANEPFTSSARPLGVGPSPLYPTLTAVPGSCRYHGRARNSRPLTRQSLQLERSGCPGDGFSSPTAAAASRRRGRYAAAHSRMRPSPVPMRRRPVRVTVRAVGTAKTAPTVKLPYTG
jgi:hypothetical protein